MKISVDGGALCGPQGSRFGNYIFTKNLIEAISLYDKENQYWIYSFCQKPIWLRETKNLIYRKINHRFWSSLRLSWEHLKEKKDVFLALNQAVPIYTGAKIISFSHGLSFHYYQKFYPDSRNELEDQLTNMVKKSSIIVVASIKIKNELLSLYPNLKNIKVIPFGVPFDMLRKNKISKKKEKFFLFVGMNHPIKNINFITRLFSIFIQNKKYSDFELYLVTNAKRTDFSDKNICIIPSITREQLKSLYQKATAHVTASYYESFNLPVLEALSQGCPVIGLSSAIIPEFKKYTYVGHNTNEFINYMERIIIRPQEISTKEIQDIFSWKKYMSSLKNVYHNL